MTKIPFQHSHIAIQIHILNKFSSLFGFCWGWFLGYSDFYLHLHTVSVYTLTTHNQIFVTPFTICCINFIFPKIFLIVYFLFSVLIKFLCVFQFFGCFCYPDLYFRPSDFYIVSAFFKKFVFLRICLCQGEKYIVKLRCIYISNFFFLHFLHSKDL